MMLGPLYEASNSKTGRKIWLAAMDNETLNLWVFDPGTNKFHRSPELSQDFAWDRRLHYEALDQAAAVKLAQKIGKPTLPDIRRRHQEDENGIPAELVLGVSTRPDERSVLRAKAQAIVDKAPGSWSIWDVYPATRARAARVCASAIRTGKHKTLAAIAGSLDSRLVTRDDGSIEVQVTKAFTGHRTGAPRSFRVESVTLPGDPA